MSGTALRRATLLALLALLGLWTLAPAQAAPEDRMTEAEAALVQRSLDRGTLIYVYDRVAWHGSDDLKAKLPDFADKIGGWIVDGPADAPQLVFFDKDEADPRIVYAAEFRGTKLVSGRVLTQGDDRVLTPRRKAMIAARRAAIGAIVADEAEFCSEESPNTVVLPPAAPGGPILVYFLTPQSTLKSVPLGGHHLVEVSADGKAGKPRAFTKTCLELPTEQGGPEHPVALAVTHLLDPVPTEIHVFTTLAAGLPIYVSTGKGKRMRIWEASGSQIRLVRGKAAR